MPGHVYDIASYPATKSKSHEEVQREPVELSADHVVRELDAAEETPQPIDAEGRKESKRLRGFFEYETK